MRHESETTINRVTLLGRAGSDPDFRSADEYTGAGFGGQDVAHLSLATAREDKESRRVDWHRLSFFGADARRVNDIVRKGSRIYVEGRLQYGSFERDGLTMPTVDVVVGSVVFLDIAFPEDE